jgi:hypothetical protein
MILKPDGTPSTRGTAGRTGTGTGNHTQTSKEKGFKNGRTALLHGQVISHIRNSESERYLAEEDPAISAMKLAGIIGQINSGPGGTPLTVGEQAKRAFEAHGLTFDKVARETSTILDVAEPKDKLTALKFINDVITLDSEAKLKQLLEASKAPTINIQINNAFGEKSNRTPLDILIPSQD